LQLLKDGIQRDRRTGATLQHDGRQNDAAQHAGAADLSNIYVSHICVLS
jgi:hypothetical protein